MHRELKALLHDARLFLSKRDQAVSPSEQHESSAGAKRCLVKAGGILTALESGLKAMAEASASAATRRSNGDASNGVSDLGEGEVRRRKDLVASARKERDALETLANSLATKRPNSTSTTPSATASDKANLFGGGKSSATTGRRVLGAPLPETERTRELDNQGVLQLQKQFLHEQDQDLESLLKTIVRQRDIGHAIGQELEEQVQMLDTLDQDATRYTFILFLVVYSAKQMLICSRRDKQTRSEACHWREKDEKDRLIPKFCFVSVCSRPQPGGFRWV